MNNPSVQNKIDKNIEFVRKNIIVIYEDEEGLTDFSDLYEGFYEPRLFAVIHKRLIDGLKDLFRTGPINGVRSVHAHPSRWLISVIDAITILQKSFEGTEYAFETKPSYQKLFNEIRNQLSASYGSTVNDSETIRTCEIPYRIPILSLKQDSFITIGNYTSSYQLVYIGSGSYANVFKYHDDYYDKFFAIKRLKPNQDSKTKERFFHEFEKLRELSCPYLLEVFCINQSRQEFVMELLDGSLEQLCQDESLSITRRNSIAKQTCLSVKYLHDKGLCHRDISPQNFLYKKYDSSIVVKMADLGIMKDPSVDISSSGTRVKGRFVDPEIYRIGFDSFRCIHDIYPLARLVAFILTGRFTGYEKYPSITQMIKEAEMHSFERIENLLSYCMDKRILR